MSDKQSVHWTCYDDPEVVVLKQTYLFVEVVRFEIHVHQSRVLTPASNRHGNPTETVSFGVADRTAQVNIPRNVAKQSTFQHLLVGGTAPRSAVVVWGEQTGREHPDSLCLPIPSGVQLDIRATENRVKWPCFFVCQTVDPITPTTTEPAHAVVRFWCKITLKCRDSPYGQSH
jgi:hypothetical protein